MLICRLTDAQYLKIFPKMQVSKKKLFVMANANMVKKQFRNKRL